MRKLLSVSLLISCYTISAVAQLQPKTKTALKQQLQAATTDSAKMVLISNLVTAYRYSNEDSSLYYSNELLKYSRRTGDKIREANALSSKGAILLEAGRIPESLQLEMKALQLTNLLDPANLAARGRIVNRIGNVYMELQEYPIAISYYRRSANLLSMAKDAYEFNEISNIGNVYDMIGKTDSAKIYLDSVYNFSLKKHWITAGYYSVIGHRPIVISEMWARLGNVDVHLGHYQEALRKYRQGILISNYQYDYRNTSAIYLNLANLFQKMGRPDSSFYYAKQTIAIGEKINFRKGIYAASILLSDIFKSRHQSDSALFYLENANKARDALYGPVVFHQLQKLALAEQQRQQQLIADKSALQNTYRMIALGASLAIFLFVALILWRNNSRQKRTNAQLNLQQQQIRAQRDELSGTVRELKSTQDQLIQSAKMASLGELTAGIAHEIQNPLNFVNNFSDVNTELLEEMKAEIAKGDMEEVKAIAADIVENEKKINMHGKRAESIVKGMLEHSRSASGQKEPIDINQLADEYLRLSYHGLKAKDKEFNADLVTHFDPTLPKVNVIPQDIGRVMLNLFNNAFYAVNQKSKTAGADYKPEVSVSTATENGQVIITVKDNGTGMPDSIKEKIMQPFFTTKPTGEGTGLGLSLTYDMVVKGHGGSIQVNSKEGEGSEFIVSLPIS